MQALHDSSGYGIGSSTHTTSWSHTIGNHSNRILIVTVYAYSNFFDANACTYNGINLTLIGGGGSSGMQTWILENPPVGTYTVQITSVFAQEWIAFSESYYNVASYVFYGTYNTGSPGNAFEDLTGIVDSADTVCYSTGYDSYPYY